MTGDINSETTKNKTKKKQQAFDGLFSLPVSLADEKKTEPEKVLTDLKDDDEGQSGSQDVPELQGELVGFRAPGWSPVVSVPAVPGLVYRLHFKHGQAAVHVASQAPAKRKPSGQGGGRGAAVNTPDFLTLTHPPGSPHTGRI